MTITKIAAVVALAAATLSLVACYSDMQRCLPLTEDERGTFGGHMQRPLSSPETGGYSK